MYLIITDLIFFLLNISEILWKTVDLLNVPITMCIKEQ